MENRLVFVAMAIFSLGCLCDHLTTAYGLTLPNIAELNMNILLLMGCGIWHFVESLVVASGIGSGFLAVRSKSVPILRASMIALFSGGLIRFYAGLHNLTIMFSTIS